jgi:hypothetical protein
MQNSALRANEKLIPSGPKFRGSCPSSNFYASHTRFLRLRNKLETPAEQNVSCSTETAMETENCDAWLYLLKHLSLATKATPKKPAHCFTTGRWFLIGD